MSELAQYPVAPRGVSAGLPATALTRSFRDVLEWGTYAFLLAVHLSDEIGLPEAPAVLLALGVAIAIRPVAILHVLKRPAYLLLLLLPLLSAVYASTAHIRNWISLLQFAVGITAGFVLYDFARAHGSAFAATPSGRRVMWVILLTSVVSLGTDLGSVSAARLLLVLATGYLASTSRTRDAALTAVVLGVFGAAVGNSKALYAAVFFALVVSLVMRARRGHAWRSFINASLTTLVAAGVIVGTVAVLSPSRIHDVVAPEDSVSTLARASTALAGLRATQDHPVLGLGPAGVNIVENFDQYYSDELLASLVVSGKTHSHAESYGEGYTSGTHNMYLDLSSSYGLPLTLLIVAGLWRGVFKARKAGRPLILFAGLSIAVHGMAWQYSVNAVGVMFIGLLMAEGWTRRS